MFNHLYKLLIQVVNTSNITFVIEANDCKDALVFRLNFFTPSCVCIPEI